MVKYIFNTLLCVVQIVFIASSVLIAQTSPLTFSEVMFYPSVTNGEFVEIYNTSATETVNLSGYKFKYYTSSNNNLISVEGGMLLKPASFAVILQGNHDFENSVYKTIIPSGTIILKTSGNNFGSSGMANTTSREISLIDPSGNFVDTYTYSADNTAGYPDEKIILSKDNSSANWGNSKRLHGTPGTKNSISPVDYDLLISSVKTIPLTPVEGDTLNINVIVINHGRLTAENYQVNIFLDIDNDSVGNNDEIIMTEQFSNLGNGDSIIVEGLYYLESDGDYTFLIEVNFSIDEKVENNSVVKSIHVSEKPADFNDIVINEIMYAPTGDEPEWIELFNCSTKSINLKSWRIGDNTSTVIISNADYLIEPNEYLIISKEQSISGIHNISSKLLIRSLPTLSNSGDDVIIRNNINKTIDSIKYTPNWGGNINGRSLERISIDSLSINRSNWGSSLARNRSTPGKINSISLKMFDVSLETFSCKNKYAEFGKNIELLVTVKNLGMETAEDFRIQLFNEAEVDPSIENSGLIEEKVIARLAKDSILSLAFIVNEYSLGVNNFASIVAFKEDEYTDNNTLQYKITGVIINEQRNDLVINEIMYSPKSPEPEWIELYNRSEKEINLSGYKIADDFNNSKVIEDSWIIYPGEYLVIAGDSLIYSFHKNLRNCVVASFPSLNNNSDRIVLLDSLDRIIDSLIYNSNWGGSNGKSLERINPFSNSTESSNWESTLSRYNGTPGKINSVSQKNYDLSLISIDAEYGYAVVGEKIKLSIIIENAGTRDVDNYKINLFRVSNNNYENEEYELIYQLQHSLLKASGKVTIELESGIINNGMNNFLVVIDYDKDQYDENNRMIYAINGVIMNEERNDIVINEIMYAPVFPEPEWIEIFNRSNKQIELKGYQIADDATKSIVVKNSLIINPGEYFVIVKDSSFLSIYSDIGKNIIISSFPSLNNTSDRIVLLDSLNRVIDSLIYKSTWGGTSGKSLERFDVDLSSTDSTNWKTSTLQSGGTPGRINSISKKNYDAVLAEVKFIPRFPLVGETTEINATVLNLGKENINVKLLLFDVSITDNKIFVEESNQFPISPGITESFTFSYKTPQIFRKQVYEVVLEAINDEDLSNNQIKLMLYPGYPYGSVILNEVMYNPVNGEPEWIELYNNSEYDIDLENWSITDVLTNPVKTKLKEKIILKSSFIIITKDSSIKNYHKSIPCEMMIRNFANLNNDADGIVIKDSREVTIDSLMYEKSWGGENGKSLERVSLIEHTQQKSNWTSSKDIEFSTPGRINSITKKNYDIALESFELLSKYADVGKQIELRVIVNNIGLFNANKYEIKIYRDYNKNNSYEADEQVFQYEEENIHANIKDTIDIRIENIEKGINGFMAVVDFEEDQALDNNIMFLIVDGIVINEQRNDLVINEIMYAPNSPEPEWIEIFNRSNKQIELKGYQIADDAVKSTVVKNSLIIYPNEHFVIAKDSSLFSIYSGLYKNIVITNFSSLNNTGDRVVLLDSLNRVIDSLAYKSTWGGASGKSLERFDVDLFSTDSTNWKTSTLQNGGTPGRINSISKKNYDGTLTKVMFYPKQPMVGESVEIQAEAYNNGKENISVSFILSIMVDKSSIVKIEESSQYNISPGESIVNKFNYRTEPIYSKQTYQVNLLIDEDEDLTNNTLTCQIYPDYALGTVMLNEIMYNPVNGEPEWIELYNNSEYDIDIENWSITDLLTNPLKIKLKGMMFPKNSFLVISKDSTVINYHKTIPCRLLINNYANLNNDADGVVIKDYWDTTIDSVRYEKSWGGDNGNSLERKSLLEVSTLKSNWSSSRDIELSTPGRINSITQKNYDLAVKEIIMLPSFPVTNEEVNFSAKIINYGIFAAGNFSIKFYHIIDSDTLLFDEISVGNLHSLDSVSVISLNKKIIKDNLVIQCVVNFNEDEELSNNNIIRAFNTGYKKGSVLVSEIMYNPYEGESEWIEIVNNSNEIINLNNWQVSDVVSPAKTKICIKEIFLEPGEYAILTPDTNKFPYYPPKKFFQTKFGTLGNTNDGVVIYDLRGLTIDSVFYNSKWGGEKGFSLERINYELPVNDSTSWATSLSMHGATPGIPNSISNIPSYNSSSIVINEIMYEPASFNTEFIEFYNTTDDSIQIGGMSLCIGNSRIVKLSSTYKMLTPHNFIILAKDSALFYNYSNLISNTSSIIVNNSISLSNSGASITLKDIYGKTIDSVFYKPNWHNKNIINNQNRTLERINPLINSNDELNWSTSVCKEGATPCYANSIFTELKNATSKVNVTPNPFSPDNDGFEDFTTINLSLSSVYSQVKIRIFDSKGRLMRTLIHYSPMASNNSIIYDGLDDNGRPLRIGIYILLIEAVNENGNVETFKLPLVSARKL